MKSRYDLIAEVMEDIEAFGKNGIVYAWVEITNPTLVVGDSTKTNELSLSIGQRLDWGD